ncbi:trans-aconitate 2-methyltransferase [Sphingosinicella sp. CPCC 101087]|uniref:class I SAM-dependent methyltransferase n=1 Tax=Sphingosinicella sp. CPCC 101087 TaxID=2497754 RepID=UPI00101D09D9|nr:class I SAM-dependent methyltransferase [Sphingosinicella sp. CPCC 101087]
MVNAASRWNVSDYGRHGAFVPALGDAALDLLAPRSDELVLDLGCGDGVLTARIAEAGARVVGLDSSPDMVAAARARGIDAFVADAEALGLEGQVEWYGRFDAVFSNAALHWMLDAAAVARGVFAVLSAGGRFVGEMGGEGNLARMREALRDELIGRGYAMPAAETQWYASVEAFRRVYADAGFAAIEAELIARPTPLPEGIAPWVRTFRAGLLDMAGVPEAERDSVAAAVERRLSSDLRRSDGTWFADYVRLRFRMKKPE